MDFLEIFTSVRYHRDMKILKILACNSKQFRVYSIFKKKQIDDDRDGEAKYYISLDNFCLKYSLVFKIPLGMFFES